MKSGWDHGAARMLQVIPKHVYTTTAVLTMKATLVCPSSFVDQAGLHPRPQEVDVFLAMDEHGAGVRGGAGNRPMAWTSAKVFPVDTPTGPGEISLGDGLGPVGIVVMQSNSTCSLFYLPNLY